MDFADIKRKALAAREFTAEVGVKSFTVRLPTPHELAVEVERARLRGGTLDPAQFIVVWRVLLERGVVGWSGVTCEDLAPGAGPEPADVSAEAVALLLDADADLQGKLYEQFVTRLVERNTKRAEAEKN